MTYFHGKIELPEYAFETIFKHYHNEAGYDKNHQKIWELINQIYGGYELEASVKGVVS
jgi:hypothetical protein